MVICLERGADCLHIVLLVPLQLSRCCSSLTVAAVVVVLAAAAVLDVLYAGCRARNFITYDFRFCLFLHFCRMLVLLSEKIRDVKSCRYKTT